MVFGSYNIVQHLLPLSRHLDRCDRMIQDESGDPNGGNVRLFSAATCTSQCKLGSLHTNARLSALIYRFRESLTSFWIAMPFPKAYSSVSYPSMLLVSECNNSRHTLPDRSHKNHHSILWLH